MKRSGVTIWELLAVIMIVIFIAAILFPVFSKARQHDTHHFCPSNEKQLGLGIIQYVQDNDQCLPNIAQVSDAGFTWRSAVYDYVKSQSPYQCPERDTTNDHSLGPDGLPRSYAANYTGNYSGRSYDQGNGAFAGAGSKPINTAEISAPAKLIGLCEVSRHRAPDYNIDNLAVSDPQNHSLWAGHNGSANFQMADGHVRMLKPLDTKDFWHRDKRISLTPVALTILSEAQQRAGK